MKKSSAPSKLKAPKSKPKISKEVVEPPLKSKQLKILQYLVSASRFINVLKSTQDNIRNIRDMSSKYYHGYGLDVQGKAKDFLAGKFRYRVLWENTCGEMSSNITEGFGPISGLSRKSIAKVIRLSTLSGKMQLDGRSILKKAKAALAECKILLAYWMDFLVAGNMPSGMNEEEALQYVLNRSYAENKAELDDDDESVDESVADNDPKKDAQQDDDSSEKSSVKDGAEESDNEGSDSVDQSVEEPHNAPYDYFPVSWILFLLYGPYGVLHYQFDISSAFTMDTDAIEELARDGKMSEKSIRQAKAIEADQAR
jgi:hypothetical protein